MKLVLELHLLSQGPEKSSTSKHLAASTEKVFIFYTPDVVHHKTFVFLLKRHPLIGSLVNIQLLFDNEGLGGFGGHANCLVLVVFRYGQVISSSFQHFFTINGVLRSILLLFEYVFKL